MIKLRGLFLLILVGFITFEACTSSRPQKNEKVSFESNLVSSFFLDKDIKKKLKHIFDIKEPCFSLKKASFKGDFEDLWELSIMKEGLFELKNKNFVSCPNSNLEVHLEILKERESYRAEIYLIDPSGNLTADIYSPITFFVMFQKKDSIWSAKWYYLQH